MKNVTIKAIFLVFTLLLSSCGYEMAKKGVVVNNEVYTSLAIPTFHNVTLSSGIESEVTTALRNTVINDGAFELYSRTNADLVLSGEITSVGNSVLSLDTIGSATEYRLSISIVFTLKENSSNQEIYADSVSGTWDYKSTNNTIDNRLASSEATTNLSKELSQEILLLIRERFSHNSRDY